MVINFVPCGACELQLECTCTHGRARWHFVPCGACELQWEEKNWWIWKSYFVPCGACELQSESIELIEYVLSISSPAGRVSCNAIKKTFFKLAFYAAFKQWNLCFRRTSTNQIICEKNYPKISCFSLVHRNANLSDILPPPTLSLRGGGFSLKYSNLHSINELTPCVPRLW